MLVLRDGESSCALPAHSSIAQLLSAFLEGTLGIILPLRVWERKKEPWWRGWFALNGGTQWLSPPASPELI